MAPDWACAIKPLYSHDTYVFDCGMSIVGPDGGVNG